MRAVIVIAASAGGVSAVMEITKTLPASIPAAVIVVMHRTLNSSLPELLAVTGRLPV